MHSIISLLGQDIEFNSDPEDTISSTAHIHTGQIIAFKKYKKQISIKLNSNEHIHNYFLDEIDILSIEQPSPPPPKRHYRTHAKSINAIHTITENISPTTSNSKSNPNTKTVSIKFGNNNIKPVTRRRSMTVTRKNKHKYKYRRRSMTVTPQNTSIPFQRCTSEPVEFGSTSPKTTCTKPKNKFASVTNALSKSWINFSKNKRKKNKNKSTNTVNNNCIFGIDPLLLKCTMVPNRDYNKGIPNILIRLKDALFTNNGHLIEGIFRKAPNAKDCKKIKEELNSDKQVYKCMNFNDINGILIANLIKIFYRELPCNILESVNDNKIAMLEKKDVGNRMNDVEMIINNDIIEPYKSYFKWLLDLCIDIIKYENINKMTCKNMAVVVSPNLYDPAKIQNPTKIFAMSGAVVVFLQIAIQWRMKQYK